MKAIDKEDWLGKAEGFHDITVCLTQEERAILERAREICYRASEKFQAATLKIDPDADNFSDTDSWAWAEIYLREALAD